MAAKMDVGHQYVWAALKPLLPYGTVLTCVKRDAQHQLAIIVRYARREGFEFATTPTLANRESWLPALNFLRGRKYKIAEPGRSLHEHGLAYDFSGPDLQRIYDAIADGARTGHIRLVRKPRNLILEHVNHCVHAEIESVRVDGDVFDSPLV